MLNEFRLLPWALDQDQILSYISEVLRLAQSEMAPDPLEVLKALHELQIRQDELWQPLPDAPLLDEIEHWILTHWVPDSESFANLARPWITEENFRIKCPQGR